jgi:septation ring formation regulator EzrA
METTNTTTSETSSADKIKGLIHIVESLAEQVRHWQDKQEKTYSPVLEALKSRVDEIESELSNASSRMNTYNEMLESASESSIGATEIPVLEHLALRVTHMERWVAKLEEKFRRDASMARKQFAISLVTLVAAAVFLGVTVWFGLSS